LAAAGVSCRFPRVGAKSEFEVLFRMWIVGGVISAGLTASVTWFMGSMAVKNLPASTGQRALLFLLVVAALSGFLSGSAIFRRVGRTREHLALFSCMSGAVAGGTIGCAYAVTVTASYLANYSAWPPDRVDQVLVLLSYPVFGVLGLFLGAGGGMLLGLILGGFLRVATLARQ
jgi:hypothetical protein